MTMGDRIKHAGQEAAGKVKRVPAKPPATSRWKPKARATRPPPTSSRPATKPRTPCTTNPHQHASQQRPQRIELRPLLHESRASAYESVRRWALPAVTRTSR